MTAFEPPIRREASALGSGAKLALLASLYFSQGLPFGFFTQALPVLLRKEGYSLEQIGLSSLLTAPWALKFLWAPAVDRWGSGRFGKRKSWIVPLQLSSAMLLIALALLATGVPLELLLVVVFFVNLLAATQDIATDGLAVDILTPRERGPGNGIQVAGYRVGMIAGGGALLIAFDHLGWQVTFGAMAALMLAATVPILSVHEPRAQPRSIERPVVHILRLKEMRAPLLLLLLYKSAENLATGMLRPFLADAGLSMSAIGALLGTAAFTAGLLGALTGGVLVQRLGRHRALVWFGVLQALAVLGYAFAALVPLDLGGLYAVCSIEHFTSGMATATLFTAMMDWCRPESAATDYTVQASTVVIATGLANAVSGFSAAALGYAGHFLLSAAGCAVAVIAALVLYPRAPQRSNSSSTGTIFT